MNYSAHYEKLIARARRVKLDGYKERHHVIPRCMGGSDSKDNIVELTAHEHFVAHQLLMKMHPTHTGLIFAMSFMAARGRCGRIYSWHKKRMSKAMMGHKRSLGKKYPKTLEHRAKISASKKGKKLSSEARKNFEPLWASRRGVSRPREHMEAMWQAIRDRPRSAEHSAKLAAANRGLKRPPRSAEYREKIAASKRGKSRGARSAEWIANHAAALRATLARKRQERLAQCQPNLPL